MEPGTRNEEQVRGSWRHHNRSYGPAPGPIFHGGNRPTAKAQTSRRNVSRHVRVRAGSSRLEWNEAPSNPSSNK